MLSSSDEKRTTTYTTETRHPTKQIPYNNHQHITISPDGTQIALLNTSMYQLKLCKYDNLSNLRTIICDKFKHIADNSRTKLSWSLSVSNEIMLSDGTVDVLIAVSCFDMESMKVNNVNSRINKSSQVQDSKHKNDRLNTSSTWIISSTRQARIPTSIDNTGGIIKFLDNKGDNSTTNLVIINAEGMSKFTIEHEKLLNDNYFSRFFNKMYKLLKFGKL